MKMLNLVQPLESTWPRYSDLFSMILQTSHGYEWILNNFIQIIGKGYGFEFLPREDPTKWSDCPFIDFNQLDMSMINLYWKDILAFIRDMIDSEYYVALALDQKPFYTHSRVHMLLVYGYDDNYLYTADHYETGKYQQKKISIAAFLEGYKLYEQQTHNDECCYSKIQLLKYRDTDYKFDLHKVKYLLNDYVKGISAHEGINNTIHDNNTVYGIEVYDVIRKHLERLRNDKSIYDYRIFTFMKDHKYYMTLRLKYIHDHFRLDVNILEDIMNRYNALYKNTKVALMLYLKYRISNSPKQIQKIEDLYNNMKSEEESLIHQLIKCLDNTEDNEDTNETQLYKY